MTTRALAIGCLVLVLLALPAQAVMPDEMLKDPAQEARARALSAGFRCLVCQNQSIDDSDADLARDLRLIIRERITKGDSDNEVVQFIVSRYGEYVLLKPRFNSTTVLLWLLPFAAVGGGLAFALRKRSRGPAEQERPLSRDERELLDKL